MGVVPQYKFNCDGCTFAVIVEGDDDGDEPRSPLLRVDVTAGEYTYHCDFCDTCVTRPLRELVDYVVSKDEDEDEDE